MEAGGWKDIKSVARYKHVAAGRRGMCPGQILSKLAPDKKHCLGEISKPADQPNRDIPFLCIVRFQGTRCGSGG